MAVEKGGGGGAASATDGEQSVGGQNRWASGRERAKAGEEDDDGWLHTPPYCMTGRVIGGAVGQRWRHLSHGRRAGNGRGRRGGVDGGTVGAEARQNRRMSGHTGEPERVRKTTAGGHAIVVHSI
jgi:hypothetical protein